MRTVTICGSMKFETEMQRIAFLLETKYNMNVLQCVYNVEGWILHLWNRPLLKMHIIEKLNSLMQFMLWIFKDT